MDLWEPNFMCMDRKRFATRLERTHPTLIELFIEDIDEPQKKLNYFLEAHLFQKFMIGDLTLEDKVKLNKAYKKLAIMTFDNYNYDFKYEV